MKTKTSLQFLLLKPAEPDVCQLLSDLYRIFNDEGAKTDIHITIRGPYIRHVSQKAVHKFQANIMQSPILIHGIGMFKNSREIVVYIKADSKELRAALWKRDYPKKEYEPVPHISLYRGSDRKRAEAVFRFLKRENLRFMCHKFELLVYEPRQYKITAPEESHTEPNFKRLFDAGLVQSGILERAKNEMDKLAIQPYAKVEAPIV